MRLLPLLAALLVVLSLSGVVTGGPIADGPSGIEASATVDAPAIDETGSIVSITDETGSIGESSSIAATNPQTTMVVQLKSDGNAEWTITVTHELDGENETAAFEALAEEFEAGQPDAGPDVTIFENLARQSAAETDREMSIESIERSSEVDDGTGTLRLEFVWTEFLAETDESLILEDAFDLGEDDRWLTSLRANQELRIHAPEEYSIVRSTVSFEDNTVTKEGPHWFDPDEHISMTFEPRTAETPNGNENGNGTDEVPPDDDWTGLGWAGFVAVVLLAVILGVAAFFVRREEGDERSPGGPAVGDDPDSSGGSPQSDASEPGRQIDGDVDGETPPDPDAQPSGDAEELTDEELALLSDEERVERLLEANGGRMRQATIVAETGWSDAKVSQLLSTMTDDGRVEKLRLGRENLISLPGHSPVSDPHERDAEE